MLSERLQQEPPELAVLKGAHGEGSLEVGLELLQVTMVQGGVGVKGGSLGKDVLHAELVSLIKWDQG